MSPQLIKDKLDQMAKQPGIHGCALVDSQTGMVWMVGADTRLDLPIWEAAVDYWRLHQRHQAVFSELGELHALALHHTSGLLAIVPCTSEPPLLLIAHGTTRSVDWRAWQALVHSVAQLVGDRP